MRTGQRGIYDHRVMRAGGLRASHWVLAVFVLVCAGTLVIGLVTVAGLPVDDNPYDTVQYAMGTVAVIIGAYVAARAPRHPFGWAAMLGGWGALLSASLYAVITDAIIDPNWLVTHEWPIRVLFAVGMTGWIWCRGVLFVVLPMLYPGGFPKGVLRRVMLAVGIVTVVGTCVCQGVPWASIDFATGQSASWTGIFDDLVEPFFKSMWVMAIVAAVDLLVRVATMRGDERRRHLPIAVAAVVLMVPPVVDLGSAVGIISNDYDLDWTEFAASFLFMLLLAYGIVRRAALGFHTVIRRTALYTGVTLVAAAMYIAIVAAFAAVLEDGTGRGPVVATGIVAISLQPVRTLVQRVLDRWVFGDRDEPYRALAGLSRRLGSTPAGSDPLEVVAEVVRSSLQLPAVSIELPAEDGGEPIVAATATSNRAGAVVERVPVQFEGRTVGTLAVTLPLGEQLTAAERRLLDDLAGAAGAVVQSARLADDLARSRDRLVRAREEERRRLRHDLHDGLGPTLASVAMGLDAAAGRLGNSELADLLHDLDRALQEAIADIRRLVYGLRPPALDELGLVPALREQARDLSARSRDGKGVVGLAIDVEAADLPPMGAAVEVAAYRIAVEGMTNVMRHAGARRCTVQLVLGDELQVTVDDDGCGFDGGRPDGVGLESMRNRASELGGDFVIGPRPGGGTRLVATLPVHDRVPA